MKPKYLYNIISVIVIVSCLCSCSSEPAIIISDETGIADSDNNTEVSENPPVLEERKAISLTDSESRIIDEFNRFCIGFTTDVCRSYDNMNVICSPLGAQMVMSMVLNGVEKENQDELINYLGISDIDALNSLNQTLIDKLPKADNATSIRLANALWWNSYRVNGMNSEYSSMFRNIYSGTIYSGDFNSDNKSVIDAINKWGFDNTNGLIPEYLKELEPSLYAIMLNALSFNSYWKNELFSKEELTEEIFKGALRDSKVKMMHSRETLLKIGEDDRFYFISLPYGNGAFEMKVFLPKEDIFISDIENVVASGRLTNLENNAQYRSVVLEMPKFNINFDLNISYVLYKSGVRSWEDCLDFTMFDEKKEGFLGLRQGLSINVDEKGTEAAAITSTDIFVAPDPVGESDVLELILDHPFYFFIQEFSTKAMIMSGRISNL